MSGDEKHPPHPEPPDGSTPPETGPAVIQRALKTMPTRPGVYRMLDAAGEVLYVGKAKVLKKRVVAYTRLDRLPTRLQRMVLETAAMEIVTTHTEAEALLLESNMIKKLRPRYNILLKDDKSFPYILLTHDHDWPQVKKHRGGRDQTGAYFGPFASASAVNQTLAVLQKVFLLRTCSDSVFSGRTRPCLLFQIKRCSAPCVGRIERAAYHDLVAQAEAFLSGRSSDVQQRLAAHMEDAAGRLAYEEAAAYRDRIRALTNIQQHQDINLSGLADADVIVPYAAGGRTCIQVFFFRGGHNNGNRAYFPAHAAEEDDGAVLEAFLGQFYATRPAPGEILLGRDIPNPALVAEALSLAAGHKVALAVPQRGDKKKLVDHARINAREALERRLAETSAQGRLLDGVADLFGLDAPPARIEVYDNSHISGTNAVGAMIVAGPDGFAKAAYRTFNIKGADLTPGDDFAMMREVLTRRFGRALKEDPERTSDGWPDLVLIDGGKGQLSATLSVLADLGITGLPVVAVAKGPDRNAGREVFHMPDRDPITLPPNDPVLYFLQRLRDEAHRFAIGTHRARRSQGLRRNTLDDIPGIGAKRKKALLHHFGSARAVSEAGLADLRAVEGISEAMARKIYDFHHNTP